jgi:polyisoprenyl-phosphate glycosyltransferase
VILSFWAGAAALLLLLAAFVAAVLGGPGLALLAASVATGMFAVLLLFLGLIGEQVRLISERTRNVPLVIEAERINFP